MAYENITKCLSMTAGQDLSSKQYYFVSLAADGQIDPTGYGQEAEGILQNDPSEQGRVAAVACVEGDISFCVAGGIVRYGKDVMSDANGRGIEATGGGRVQGVAMTTASAAGDIFSVMLKRQGAIPQVTTTTTTSTTSTSTSTTSTSSTSSTSSTVTSTSSTSSTSSTVTSTSSTSSTSSTVTSTSTSTSTSTTTTTSPP
jgi:hypothetical protein